MKQERAVLNPPFYKLCLQRALSTRCSRNSRYSIRAFARALGVDHAALSRFLSGERIPSYKIAIKILKNLDLTPAEEQSFLNSIALIRKDTFQRISPIYKTMPLIPDTRELSLELFRVISDWYHYAILELTLVKNFKSDPKWISKELGISVAETKMAIDRLRQLELLEIDEKGVFRKSLGHMTTADKHLTNSALKRHQKQIYERAVESLENDPIEDRSMTSMTMAINPEKLPLARQMIEEFTQSLCQFLEVDERKQVYELGICLYPVQKKTNKNQEVL